MEMPLFFFLFLFLGGGGGGLVWRDGSTTCPTKCDALGRLLGRVHME
jgi:hypothetical protein